MNGSPATRSMSRRFRESPTSRRCRTLAFWSRRDGLIAPRAARGLDGERDKAVEIDCTHMAFGVSRRTAREVVREVQEFLRELGMKPPSPLDR